MPDEQTVIAEFPKSDDDKIVVSAGLNRGARFVDVRQYWRPEDNGGEWVPTKRGARFPAEIAGEIADAIRQGGGA